MPQNSIKAMNKKSVDIKSIDLVKLKRKLNHGDQLEIARLTGYSAKYVYACLDPKNPRRNKKILQAAIEVIENNTPISVEMSEELEKEVVA